MAEISITKYDLQKNTGLLNQKEGVTPLKEELGYYLMADSFVANCYRNNDTIDQTVLTTPERKMVATREGIRTFDVPTNTGSSVAKSTSRFKPRPCGSHCAAFQIVEDKKKTFVRLNCIKSKLLIENVVPNEFPLIKK